MLKRLFILPMLFFFIHPISASSQTKKADIYWGLDLGGKTLNLAGTTKGLAGIRLRILTRSNLSLAGAAYALPLEAKTVTQNDIQKQRNIALIGFYLEYNRNLLSRVSIMPNVLFGYATGEFEEKSGDLVSIQRSHSFGVEPGASLLLQLHRKINLNIGGGYFLLNQNPGIRNGWSLNIHARYYW